MQRARADEREVRDQGAELCGVLDAADEVGLGGVVLVDDRGPARGAVVDQQVHLEAAEGRRLRDDPADGTRERLAGHGRCGDELVRAGHDVPLDNIEVRQHLG